jgi:nucleoside-diphosphate-sugar epimerase
MHVIVTGGSGFIGSRLVTELLALRHQVSVVDVVPLHAPGITLYQDSVLDTGAMRRVIRDADAVVHLAGYVREAFLRDQYQGSMLQLQGTLNVLEACRLNRVPHFLLASSFYVYQNLPDALPVDEKTPLDLLQMDLFGGAKFMSEAMCREYTRKYGVNHTILRLGSAYGPGGSNVIRTFIEMGLQRGVLEVWGEGKRRNQYTFVGDLASGIIASLDSRNETFNLTSPEVTATSCLVEMLCRESGFTGHFDLARHEEPSLPYMSPSKAMEKLGWTPTGLREGLAQTVRDIQDSLVVTPIVLPGGTLECA